MNYSYFPACGILPDKIFGLPNPGQTEETTRSDQEGTFSGQTNDHQGRSRKCL